MSRSPATIGRPWTPHDRNRLVTATALLTMAAAGALALGGLPPIDLHGPLHRIGIMGPLCGGTRAAYYSVRGDWGLGWRYNPLGGATVVAALLGTLRAGLGLTTGRWLTLPFARTPHRIRIAVLLGVVLLVALEVRQQLHAPLLMAGTGVWS